jgi:ketosteroid isomerase-like protein
MKVLPICMLLAVSVSSGVESDLRAAEQRVFEAIRTKDVAALGRELSDDFVHSSPGQPDQPREAFLAAIRDMPYVIRGIEGQEMRVRELGETALLSGVQSARVALPDGREAVARTAFVDVFTRQDGRWRLRHAWSVELPEGEAR